jgi:hypothetical protein
MILMDCFGSSNDFLSTTGVGPCVGFVVLLANGQNIFIEHRTDMYLPRGMNINNVRLCFNPLSPSIFFANACTLTRGHPQPWDNLRADILAMHRT